MEPENYRLGIDVGGTNMRAAVVKDSKVVSEILERDTPDTLDEFHGIVNGILKHFAVDERGSVGIAIPGMVDYEKQKIIFCPNLTYLNDLNISEFLKHDKLKIGNDADLTLLGELSSRDLWEKNLAVITLGTGIGSAFYLNKMGPWQSNLSCEIGHTKVVADGLKCSCGKNGCLEAYFSGWSLIREAFENEIEVEDVVDLFQKHRAGDIKAQYVLSEATKYLALAMADLINLTGIDHVIIGGKIAYSYDLMQQQIDMNLNSFVHMREKRDLLIEPSTLIDHASLIGAAEITKV